MTDLAFRAAAPECKYNFGNRHGMWHTMDFKYRGSRATLDLRDTSSIFSSLLQ